MERKIFHICIKRCQCGEDGIIIDTLFPGRDAFTYNHLHSFSMLLQMTLLVYYYLADPFINS